MQISHTIGTTLGGLGLFLIAIMLISNGLRMAAGRALQQILAKGTGTHLRGLMSGMLITALVQSSSAVTAATIGFVNAGLMNLSQSLGVIYGSNIGTTMTGWLVAAIGFRFKMEAFALPLIGIGAFMKLAGDNRRMGALGEAVAGFGLFFYGIDVLKTAFEGMAAGIDMTSLQWDGPLSSLMFLGVGVVLTVLMQSSSAAIAVTLTAAASNIIPLQQAAAVVIGANIGTTSTAILAAIGATPNARRTAAAHVIFNLLTASVALLIMPLMLWSTVRIRSSLGIAAFPATDLALFHTVFNVLGALLMWPFTHRLSGFLQKRFRTQEEDEARPQYLDSSVAKTPHLAQHALVKELQRMGGISLRAAKSALSSEIAGVRQLAVDKSAMHSLEITIADFVANLDRTLLPNEVADFLPQTIRVSQYYDNVAELAASIAEMGLNQELPADDLVAQAISDFKSECVSVLKLADPVSESFSREAAQRAMGDLQEHYQALKRLLLKAGSERRMPVQEMVDQLDQMSRTRRMVEQSVKAARYLEGMREQLGVSNDPSRDTAEATTEEADPKPQLDDDQHGDATDTRT